MGLFKCELGNEPRRRDVALRGVGVVVAIQREEESLSRARARACTVHVI